MDKLLVSNLKQKIAMTIKSFCDIAYMILYTTDDTSSDNEWITEIVEGELMSYSIKGLTPSTNYFFKIQAKNSIGYGPFSTTISIKTLPGTY